jgi:hypothetical protein
VEQLFLEGRGLFPGFNYQQDGLKKHLGYRMEEEGMRKSTTHLTIYHIKVWGVRGENPIFIANFHVNG